MLTTRSSNPSASTSHAEIARRLANERTRRKFQIGGDAIAIDGGGSTGGGGSHPSYQPVANGATGGLPPVPAAAAAARIERSHRAVRAALVSTQLALAEQGRCERFAALESNDLAADASPRPRPTLAGFAALVARLSEELVAEGSAVRHVFVVVAGAVDLRKRGEKVRMIDVDSCPRGAWIGRCYESAGDENEIHAFTATAASPLKVVRFDRAALVDFGCRVGFTGFLGIAKRSGATREAIAFHKSKLGGRLLLETDAPFMMPDKTYLPSSLQKRLGLRGGKNEPAVLPAVCRALADALGRDASDVARETTEASQAFFGFDGASSDDDSDDDRLDDEFVAKMQRKLGITGS